jgi:S-DNA-T family DNA segregation ATPase FtsK/SpoIIIE
MRELIDTPEFYQQNSKLSAGLGKDIAGNCVYCDISKMPHLLVAGTTGSGKSVCMNSIITSILYRAKPNEVKFLMIDPKQVEFSKYAGIPHLLVPVVTDPRKAAGALGWAVSEMLQRYQRLSQVGVRDIEGYNKYVSKHEDMEPMPKICIFIDEFADLMMAAPKEVEDSVCRLAQMARAVGMHLVIATQRPSVDVITGLIKANISSRIALTVSSQIDSRTILDASGAEKLLGHGDMLYSPIGASKPIRVQGCFISDDEVEELCDFVKNQGESQYDETIAQEIEAKAVQDKKSSPFEDDGDGEQLDALFDKAVDVVLETGTASTSFLQRKLSVGYARGAKIIDQLQEKGIIGPANGSKPREILISRQQWLEMQAYSGNGEFTAANTEQMSFDDTEDEPPFEIEEEFTEDD